MQKINHHALAVAAAALLAAFLTGCGGDPVAQQVAAMNTSNIQRISNMYSAFQNMKGGRGPANEAELKEFIKGFDPAKLQMMGIDPNKVDELFISERDNKPFKIRYKVGGGRGSVAPVTFEQEGKDGKRQVGFTGNTKVEEVDSTEYEQLWAGRGTTQPAAGTPAGKAGGRATGRPAGAPTGPPGK